MISVAERFLKYVKFDTQSDEFSENCPSTDGQRMFGEFLVAEMKQIGITDALIDNDGYVYGTVPGDPELPVIGLIAHMDTSPDASGKDVKTSVIPYDGQMVLLNPEKKIYLCETEYESLKNQYGKRLIVTDGTTLLGADDKAGIAEIMTLADTLIRSGKRHATIRIAFTPDEEIGRGADRFNVDGFGADYAYTVDGGALGEIEYENFNAASAMVVFHGLNIHPGSAKDKMVNSQYIAMDFQRLLPCEERPENTEGYEGFIHLTDMEGCVEETVLRYIIRDHDKDKFETKKLLVQSSVAKINEQYGLGTAELVLKDSYYNMREKIEPCMYIVDRAVDAMKKIGVDPIIVPIRGGTDGARLSFMGLPCPNLCTGGHNFHGRFEYIAIEDMEKCVQLLQEIVCAF